MLSLAGRAVLIQASSAAIPAYVMQCTYIPNSILEGVDRVNRNFLWGSTEASKKIHWVGWQKVTKSKEEGGLGLQNAKGRNTALLAKLNWRFNVEKESLWARVLRNKYCSQRRINSANEDKLPCSQIWKALKKGRGIFNEGSMWTIGRESSLRFWWDNWTGKGPLRYMIQGPLTRGADQWKVCEILVDFSWNWGLIPFELPVNIKALIQAIPNPIISRGQDRIAWSGNPRGTFDLKSAYSLATADVAPHPISSSCIWKIDTLPKIKTFLWRCTHNCIGV